MAKFCTKCGAALEESKKFCGYCGQPVRAKEAMDVFVPDVQPVKSSVLREWWFWTLAALAVTAAVIVGVLWLKADEGKSGNFAASGQADLSQSSEENTANHYREDGKIDFGSFPEFESVYHPQNDERPEYNVEVVRTIFDGERTGVQTSYIWSPESASLAFVIGERSPDNSTVLKLISLDEYIKSPHAVHDYLANTDDCDIAALGHKQLLPYVYVRSDMPIITRDDEEFGMDRDTIYADDIGDLWFAAENVMHYSYDDNTANSGTDENNGGATIGSSYGDYIFPQSATAYLTDDDLRTLDKGTLRLARNEILARHGRRFKDETLQAYFDSKPWYSGTIPPAEFDKQTGIYNSYEVANIELIKKYENQ